MEGNMTEFVRDISSGSRRRPRTAACFGGGGAFGIAFNLGVATALQDHGIPVEQGPMLGTSAGSWTAAALATGLTLQDLVPTWSRPAPEGRRRVIDSSREVWGSQRDSRVTGIALQVPLGRRRLLSGRHHRLADVVAASSSLPGFASPHLIDGKRYIDGGLFSNASADRAPRADMLIVAVPMAGTLLGTVGTLGDRFTRIEIARWSLRNHGRRALYIRPDRRFAPFLRRFGDVMAVDRVEEIHAKAYDLGAERLELFRAREDDQHACQAA
jgi:predicted acylesterase/phospholipase RssA